MVTIHFRLPDGSLQTVKAEIGLSLLEVAHENAVPLEGACEGSLACSTCHIIIDEEYILSSVSANGSHIFAYTGNSTVEEMLLKNTSNLEKKVFTSTSFALACKVDT